MAKMTTTQILLLTAGIGAIGYYLWQKNAAASTVPGAPVVIPPGASAPVDTVTEYPIPAGGMPSSLPAYVPPLTAGQSTSLVDPLSGRPGYVAPSSAFVPPNGIDPNVYGVVMAWIGIDGDSRMNALGAAAIPSEFNGLYNIIQNNLWGSPSVQDFWNSIIAKYSGQ